MKNPKVVTGAYEFTNDAIYISGAFEISKDESEGQFVSMNTEVSWLKGECIIKVQNAVMDYELHGRADETDLGIVQVRTLNGKMYDVKKDITSLAVTTLMLRPDNSLKGLIIDVNGAKINFAF